MKRYRNVAPRETAPVFRLARLTLFALLAAGALVQTTPPAAAALQAYEIFLERDPLNDQGDPAFDLAIGGPIPTQFVATFVVDTVDIPVDTAGGFVTIALDSFFLQIGAETWTETLFPSFPSPTIDVRSAGSKINGVQVPLIETTVNFVTLQIGGLVPPFGWTVTTGETVIGGPEPSVKEVPVPAAGLLLVSALFGLATLRRRPPARPNRDNRTH